LGNRPPNEVERIVAGAWQEALGIPSIGLNDNFFDVGAHSLTVAEVHARLQQALGREIALVDLYQFSTVSALATHLAGTQQVVAATQLSDRAQRRRLGRQR
jgi:acyl carrier protein